ncbi:dicarboxylate/amino acid:cation symporter [Paraglaciecola sp. MB-3u-78]|jgi:Na+/H+-dicarboxylate symporter|uniref:dicarboxylate/amino acid:cation symporter n=1 Tax=Paraglaciecola sp. MB-3u-78 TaxID=2058332 RepID=UPI000C32F040|nr:dicarboxylate/amino acid:cation symporter [Paraglaciecola sp. MB-3u-78]PKG97463.1 dicarboxylate/amino acid:cation symporter [Paraglaciecola sp. MB-3u-78]
MTTSTHSSSQKPASQKLGLTARIFIGMIAGIIIGALLQWLFDNSGDFSFSVFGMHVSTYALLVEGIFNIVGSIFIASLKMLVVPLVFVSLVCGTSSLSDPSKLGRLGGKSILLYVGTTAIAISLAVTFALLVAPGQGLNLATESTYIAKEAPSLGQVIINMMPTNPINAMAEGNMLQIIVFAVLFGIAMTMTGEPGKRLISVFEDFSSVIMKLVTILMNLAPYGVFALMAKLSATIGLETFSGLLKYFFLVVFVLFIHAFMTYPIILKLLSGLSPLILIRKMRDAALFAFSTASSSATLPVTMETAISKLGVKRSVASFTVPLGSTINMDGTAIMQGVATVFIAQVYAVDLSLSDYMMVILTATLASIGTAGVPGVGLIMLAMVLQQVNLPVEGIALIIGVDRLLDMTRTAVNVTGDCMVACIVGKSENELDIEVYNDPNAGIKSEEVDFEHFDKNT